MFPIHADIFITSYTDQSILSGIKHSHFAERRASGQAAFCLMATPREALIVLLRIRLDLERGQGASPALFS